MSHSETPAGLAHGFDLNTDERDLIRSLIVADPQLVLGDDQVMRALIGEAGGNGRQIVDLRDRLVERLETRLDRLVRANRSMIAAAYENVSGTQAVHRALIRLMDAPDLGAFLRLLTQDVPRSLDLAEARLCIEADVDATQVAEGLGDRLEDRVLALPEGTVEAYLMLDGRAEAADVVLRPAGPEAELIFGDRATVHSEALLRLEVMGAIGLLAFGSGDPDRFAPDQGTDLLRFLGAAVGRLLAQRLGDDPG